MEMNNGEGCPVPRKTQGHSTRTGGIVIASLLGLVTTTSPIWLGPAKLYVDRATVALKIETFTIEPVGEVDPGTEVLLRWKVRGANRTTFEELLAGALPPEGEKRFRASLTSQVIHLRAEDEKGTCVREAVQLNVRGSETMASPVAPDPREEAGVAAAERSPSGLDTGPSGPYVNIHPTLDPTQTATAPSAEANSDSNPTLHNGKPCLTIGRIIPLHDGSAGATSWDFEVTVSGREKRMLGAASYNDSSRDGSEPRNGVCIPFTLEKSGAVDLLILGWKEGKPLEAHGEGLLIPSSFAQILPVKNPKDDAKGSFLFEIQFPPGAK